MQVRRSPLATLGAVTRPVSLLLYNAGARLISLERMPVVTAAAVTAVVVTALLPYRDNFFSIMASNRFNARAHCSPPSNAAIRQASSTYAVVMMVMRVDMKQE